MKLVVCNFLPPLLGLLENGDLVLESAHAQQIAVLSGGPGHSPYRRLLSTSTPHVRSELAHLLEALRSPTVDLHETFRIGDCQVAARRRVLIVSLPYPTRTMVPLEGA